VLQDYRCAVYPGTDIVELLLLFVDRQTDRDCEANRPTCANFTSEMDHMCFECRFVSQSVTNCRVGAVGSYGQIIIIIVVRICNMLILRNLKAHPLPADHATICPMY
jgi:hypothetical protein